MKTLWMILAGVGGVIAVVFVFRGDYEKAFVAAAAGAVCWFLNYRQQLRATLPSDDEDNQEDEDEEVRS
ncbi:MAG TPA: hypothetical protein VE980_15960 [Pyrinomonadaceae bacterium]|nr:hypothetical protein [Pyrinomonadaceae bacterium]